MLVCGTYVEGLQVVVGGQLARQTRRRGECAERGEEDERERERTCGLHGGGAGTEPGRAAGGLRERRPSWRWGAHVTAT